MHRRFLLIVSLLTVMGLLLSACGGGAAPTAAPAGETPAADATPAPSGEAATLEYWLWDSNQLPAYQQCADAFMAANPNIKVNISQKGWDDYWSGIQNGMIAGNAPDVFTDHLAKYPEFAAKGQLVDIQPYIERDGVDMTVYLKGLADLWGRDGKQYGLPKDWDTIAIVYNKDMLDKAGVTVDEVNAATWNPDDGGSFAELIAKLTLDESGKNALDPAFDKTKVAQYGFVPDGPDNTYGQTGWSWLAATTGWRHVDEIWGTKYNFDDPRVAATLQWMADMMASGAMMPSELVSSLGGSAAFNAGKGALHPQGSWMIGEFVRNAPFTFGFARLPQGPEGRRSMFNGLADSIWTGTKNPDAAWQLVKFLASKECADIVGDAGVVFPAQQSGVDKAIAAYEAKNVDVSAFTDQATEPDGTFLFPVTDHAAEIDALVKPAIQSVLLGQAKAADALPPVNEQVNALFQ